MQFFWTHLSSYLEEEHTREETVQHIHDWMVLNAATLFPQNCACCSVHKAEREFGDLKREIVDQTSWLSSDTKFQHIQSIFKAKHFAFVKADLFNPETTTAIAKKLQERNLTLDSIYLSNTKEYAEVEGLLPKYREAMKPLQSVSRKETYLFDTKDRDIDGSLVQRMRSGFHRCRMEEAFPERTIHRFPHYALVSVIVSGRDVDSFLNSLLPDGARF